MGGHRGSPGPRRRPGEFETVRQIRGAMREAGSLWFSEGAMRMFGTRVHQSVYGGRVFVTSEKDPLGRFWGGERRYTVRRVTDDFRIETVGEFGAHSTSSDAHREAARVAGEGESDE